MDIKSKLIAMWIANIMLFHLSFLLPASALSGPENSTNTSIKKIIRSLGIPQSKLAISVKDAAKGSEIISINSDELLNPASNIKILTSYCALKKLGINYKWQTKVLSDTTPADGAAGDIYILGSGDPYLVSENLWMFAKELLNRNIREIKGNITLDSSLFEWIDGPSEFKNSYDRSFTAKPSAVSLNFNSVTIYVYAGKPGKAPKVLVDPELEYFVIDNRALSVSDGSKARPKLSVDKIAGKTKITVAGTWSPRSKKIHYRKVFHPEIYFGYALEKFYTELGGKFHGKIKTGTIPKNSKELFTFDSKPLYHSIYGLNKFSNNFMASQILLTMGSEENGIPGTMEKGLSSLESCFYSLGIQKPGNRITSASGLSLDTRISASQISDILIHAKNDFQLSPEFISSLGIYGDDGTVRKRDMPEEFKGTVRVKTGNLDGVDALSGYIKTKKSNYLVFSVIANGFKDSDRHKYRELQDKLISYLFNNL